MIKSPIDGTMLVESIESTNELFDMPDVKTTINELNKLLL